MPKFTFFFNIVAALQLVHPHWDNESCERHAITTLFTHWKPASDGHVNSNVSLYLYHKRLLKAFPHLVEYAEQSTMWTPEWCSKKISFINKMRRWA